MDEKSTTVAVLFLLRGRWYNTAILSFTLCMHECVGKFCAFPLALCVCCGDLNY